MESITLTAEQFQRISRALGDATRYKMLRRIYAQDDLTCGVVCDELPVTAGTASHHFRELEEAELIQVTKFGRYRKLAARRDIWCAYLAQLRQL